MAKHRKAHRNHGLAVAAGVGTGAIAVISIPATASAADWDALAQCETGGAWQYPNGYAAGGDNGFDGGLQFLPSTWNAYGGREFAASASDATREQQIVVAERVLAAQGPGAWPGCTAKDPGWFTRAGAVVNAPAPVAAPAPVQAQDAWMWPVDAPVTSSFGNRDGGFHNGTDFGAPIGTPVHAITSGTITAGTGFNTDPGGYGNYIAQQADTGENIEYGHVSEIYVSTGEYVEVGDVIGAVGNAGSSTGPHLHLRIDETDPVAFLKARNAADTGEYDQQVLPVLPDLVLPDVPVPVAAVAPAGATPIFSGLAEAYAVENGDTLTTIAGRFGTSVDAILAHNEWIGVPDLIFVGDTLDML